MPLAHDGLHRPVVADYVVCWALLLFRFAGAPPSGVPRRHAGGPAGAIRAGGNRSRRRRGGR